MTARSRTGGRLRVRRQREIFGVGDGARAGNRRIEGAQQVGMRLGIAENLPLATMRGSRSSGRASSDRIAGLFVGVNTLQIQVCVGVAIREMGDLPAGARGLHVSNHVLDTGPPLFAIVLLRRHAHP
jgi:hypothetical protein